ncbi:hypothetical protein J4E90_005816 [Alternaria incomplexa]|uniref:uncharacterized protein n=1 Tax=Alternaria incomplexa TaxID=1187928 RepID=UPI0022206DDB|nr:uncharacterized protein J4E90_005816 [Alternaria incomplexa]KAI4914095.1 hypothetical protein J4E90_005816 [Alternaria incomplexa]
MAEPEKDTKIDPVVVDEHHERKTSIFDDEQKRKESVARLTANLEGEIRNPLVDIPREQLLANVHDFATEHQLTDVEPLLVKGALLAQSPALFEDLEELDENDRTAIREEITHRFKLPRTLYFTIILNSVAAAIQGWDQTGSNGANLTFGQALGIPDSGPVCEAAGTCEKNGWIIGFINACPYIAIACESEMMGNWGGVC